MFFFWIIQVWWSCWIWNKGYHRYNQGYFLLWPTPIDWQWASVCSERNSMTKEIISMWLYLLYEHSSSLCICMGAYFSFIVHFLYSCTSLYFLDRGLLQTRKPSFEIFRSLSWHAEYLCHREQWIYSAYRNHNLLLSSFM